MTGPKRNSEFYFPETRGNNSLFSAGPVITCFVIPSNSKVEQNCEEIVCFTPVSSQIYRGFKEHDLVTCDWKVQAVFFLGSNWFLFPRELVTRSPPIGKRISAGKYNKPYCYISQLKYVLRLEENASRPVGQNSLAPWGKNNELFTRTWFGGAP